MDRSGGTKKLFKILFQLSMLSVIIVTTLIAPLFTPDQGTAHGTSEDGVGGGATISTPCLWCPVLVGGMCGDSGFNCTDGKGGTINVISPIKGDDSAIPSCASCLGTGECAACCDDRIRGKVGRDACKDTECHGRK